MHTKAHHCQISKYWKTTEWNKEKSGHVWTNKNYNGTGLNRTGFKNNIFWVLKDRIYILS